MVTILENDNPGGTFAFADASAGPFFMTVRLQQYAAFECYYIDSLVVGITVGICHSVCPANWWRFGSTRTNVFY